MLGLGRSVVEVELTVLGLGRSVVELELTVLGLGRSVVEVELTVVGLGRSVVFENTCVVVGILVGVTATPAKCITIFRRRCRVNTI